MVRRAAVFPAASSVGVARSPRVGVPSIPRVVSGGWWVCAGVILGRLGDLLVHPINTLEQLRKKWVICLQDFIVRTVRESLVELDFGFSLKRLTPTLLSYFGSFP